MSELSLMRRGKAHERRMSGNLTAAAADHWPGHVSHCKVTASAAGLKLLEQGKPCSEIVVLLRFCLVLVG